MVNKLIFYTGFGVGHMRDTKTKGKVAWQIIPM